MELYIEKKFDVSRSYPKKTTKLVLVGLTPGKQQSEIINSSRDLHMGAFAGSMRKQIFTWFESLGINSLFSIANESSIFKEKLLINQVYITSLLWEPVFIKRGRNLSNYSGKPFPWKNQVLQKMMEDTFKYLAKLKSECLIVPMGKVVSISIADYSNLDNEHYVLHGFPHPSGANGHRFSLFQENKTHLRRVVKTYANRSNAKIKSRSK
ncbi:MAG: hypothetical protein AB8G05_23160 [Oligoflexales bacterium]